MTGSSEGAPAATNSRVAAVLRAANQHPSALVALAWGLMAVPGLRLAWETARGSLGTNPLEIVVHTPAHWALILLIAVLVVTPLRHALVASSRLLGVRWGRRFADWNWLVRLRRPIGLASFAYAVTHVGLYAWFDLDLDWLEFVVDVRRKPYVLAGLAAFVLLVPLALTSSDAWVRRLKRRWKLVHSLIYPAAVLVALHFAWLSKPGVTAPYGYMLAIFALLAYRVIVRWRPTKGAPAVFEAEAPERHSRAD